MLFEEERKTQLLQYLERNQRASVQELSEIFEVSESTIRRDLKELEEARLLKRTHGGAVSLQSTSFEPSILDKEVVLKKEKESIARVAAQQVQQGDTILLDSGTTTLHLAREIKHIPSIRVITNSMLVLNELKDNRNIEITLLGGILRPETQAFVGPMTEQALGMIRVDKAFIATNGIDLIQGITTPNLIEASTKRRMIRIAGEVILLADHSKIGKVAYAKVADLSEIHHCIFDQEVSTKFIHELNKLDIQVTLAQEQESLK